MRGVVLFIAILIQKVRCNFYEREARDAADDEDGMNVN